MLELNGKKEGKKEKERKREERKNDQPTFGQLGKNIKCLVNE